MELRHQGAQGVNDFSDDLVGICRHFGMFERDAVCCGTVTVQQCVALQTLLNPAPTSGAVSAGTVSSGTVSTATVSAGTVSTATEGFDVTALATHLGVTKSAVTRLVDGMEKRGWVERVRGEQDRRRVLVQLTDSGSEEALRLRRLTVESVQAVMQHIPAEAHDDVLRAMKLVRSALDKARASGGISCC